MQSHGVRPPEAGSRLAAHEEEAVTIVHAGEVDETRRAAVEELEAPHETRKRDVRVTGSERLDRAGSQRRSCQLDLEPLGGEVTAVYGDWQGRVEDGTEGFDDSETATRRHDTGVYARLISHRPLGPFCPERSHEHPLWD